MRRWNGWGDDTVHYPLHPHVVHLLAELLGPGKPPRDAPLASVLARVPASRLPSHPLVSTDPIERLCHARGQSFPDLVALRSGQIPAFPDGVAYPLGGDEVRALLRYAREVGAHVIPYGGGTSVVGHVNPQSGPVPVLTIDLCRCSSLIDLQPENRLATFGAGVAGPDLEAQLRAHGYTLGHFPQSFERSTLGGWIATRSIGQQSLGYGRIDQLFVGGRLEAPAGSLDLPPFPASATGPDLRQLLLGSEGRLGILSEATVRISPLPEVEAFHAVFFPDWEHALAAARTIAQGRISLSMLRLSLPTETTISLAMAGNRRLVSLLENVLALRRIGEGKCMLLLGVTGGEKVVKLALGQALGIARDHGGVHVGRSLGRQWQKSRFRAPYLRDELWQHGYAVDTVETATSWDNVTSLAGAVETALCSGLAERGERVHAFTHLSHVYPTGSSIYTTFLFRLGHDAGEMYERWAALKHAASRAVIEHGGTISHQHGVGTDHRAYLEAEKGALGVAAMRHVVAAFDPDGLLNPGKLV